MLCLKGSVPTGNFAEPRLTSGAFEFLGSIQVEPEAADCAVATLRFLRALVCFEQHPVYSAAWEPTRLSSQPMRNLDGPPSGVGMGFRVGHPTREGKVQPLMNYEVATWMDTSVRNHGGFGILAGSAISFWAPSGLPTALGLRDEILTALIEQNYLVGDLRTDLEHQLVGSASLQLETVLEEIDLHICDRLPGFISVLANGVPNEIHLAIANWVASKKLHVLYTTNQDVLIEKGLEEKGFRRDSSYRVATPEAMGNDSLFRVAKLHGTIDDVNTLRTTFTQVGRQLPKPVRDRLKQDLERLPFLVLGYSGRDIDIRPIFLEADLCDVLWLEWPAFTTDHFASTLSRAGKRIHPCVCNLAQLVTTSALKNESSLGAQQAAINAKANCFDNSCGAFDDDLFAHYQAICRVA